MTDTCTFLMFCLFLWFDSGMGVFNKPAMLSIENTHLYWSLCYDAVFWNYLMGISHREHTGLSCQDKHVPEILFLLNDEDH